MPSAGGPGGDGAVGSAGQRSWRRHRRAVRCATSWAAPAAPCAAAAAAAAPPVLGEMCACRAGPQLMLQWVQSGRVISSRAAIGTWCCASVWNNSAASDCSIYMPCRSWDILQRHLIISLGLHPCSSPCEAACGLTVLRTAAGGTSDHVSNMVWYYEYINAAKASSQERHTPSNFICLGPAGKPKTRHVVPADCAADWQTLFFGIVGVVFCSDVFAPRGLGFLLTTPAATLCGHFVLVYVL